jgi:hypothetical protein
MRVSARAERDHINGAHDLAQGVWKNFGHGLARYRLGVARYRLAAWMTAPASASRPAASLGVMV